MTAMLDRESFAIFDRLRAMHFPAHLNHLSAHLTLFHHLPGDGLRRILDDMEAIASETAPLSFEAPTTRLLGRGVAIEIHCPPLVALRKGIAGTWAEHLTPQDRNGFKPHVTVQNKATPEAARTVRPEIEALLPMRGRIEGLELFVYRGGPWEDAARVEFRGAA